MAMWALYLSLISILLCVTISGQHVPTNLSCGTASDVKSVTNYPFTITSRTDARAYTTTTWKGPFPDYNITYINNNKVVSYLVRSIGAFRETNSVANPMDVYNDVNLLEATWEASATSLTSCEGFYLKTTLGNGGIIEIVHYTYHDKYQYTYGEQTHTINIGQSEHNFYISNYTVAFPNVSLYQLEIYARYPVSVSDFSAYRHELGSFFPGDEDNTTSFFIETLPKIDPTIGVVTFTNMYMNYALINNSQPTHITVIGDSDEMTGAGVLSLVQNETYVGEYHGSGDTFRFSTKYGFFITPDDSVDGSDSSSVSLFGESIFSSLHFWFLV